MSKIYSDKNITLYHGKNMDVLKGIKDNSIDSIVTDPPYELGFMGKHWDSSGIAYDVSFWKECLRVLKPGGTVLDPFVGSGTTMVGCVKEGFKGIGIDEVEDYFLIACSRVSNSEPSICKQIKFEF